MDTPTQNNIAELISLAEKAAEPGTLNIKQVISNGLDDQLPAVITKIESAGYVVVYNTKTCEPSLVNRNMLTTQLKKRHKDGTLAFTTIKPSKKPFRGTLTCMLHPDSPNRPHYNNLGFAVCRKSNLTSPHQVERHMMHRHPQEWATIEKERIQKEKQEDRDFQRSLMENLKGKPEIQPANPESLAASDSTSNKPPAPEEPELYVSDKPPKQKRKRRK